MENIRDIADIEMAEVDMFDPDYSRDPVSVYDAARKVHPWLAKYRAGYLILDQATMQSFLRDDARCRTPNHDITQAWNAKGTPFARFTENQLVALAGAEHKRIRDLVAPAFTPRAASRHRAFMRQVFEEILSELGDASSCNVNDIASQYPITVMCSLIGVPREDIQKFVKWLEVGELAFGQDASVLPRLNESYAALYEYVAGLLEERRGSSNPPDDLLQSLIDLVDDGGDELTDEELQNLLILLLGAGYDTTKNQINLIMRLLIDYPDVHQRLIDDPGHTKKFIEESLRFINPIGATHRVTNEDIVVRGVRFPANTFVSLPVVFSGRDPERNPDPDVFDTDREKINHISFGQGIHMCLGQFLARALLEEAVPMLARHFRNPKPAGEPVYRSPLGIWGYFSLPIVFERGAITEAG